jgi:hypothetical protein
LAGIEVGQVHAVEVAIHAAILVVVLTGVKNGSAGA